MSGRDMDQFATSPSIDNGELGELRSTSCWGLMSPRSEVGENPDARLWADAGC